MRVVSSRNMVNSTVGATTTIAPDSKLSFRLSIFCRFSGASTNESSQKFNSNPNDSSITVFSNI